MWLVQVISWLPEALRPGVFLIIVILLLWFVFVRRGLPAAWRASCRGAARVIDSGVGGALRIELVITRAKRQRGMAPPRWAFAAAGVSETLEDWAARLYQRNRNLAKESTQPDSAEGKKAGVGTTQPPRKPSVPWQLCAAVVVVSTAAWIAMDQLPETSIPRYRISQAFDPWRDIEEWAGASSDRDSQPMLVRTRLHPGIVNARLACKAVKGCRGWVLLKGQNEALVAVHYVSMTRGSILVQFHLSAQQRRKAPVADLMVTGV
jgi:hypothetical protein